MSTNTLLFIYNAKSGALNSAFDTVHKIISPSTYNCNLCTLTHGSFSEKENWKKFQKEYKGEIKILYKDEFVRQYEFQTKFPAILMKAGEKIETVLNSNDINQIYNLDELITKLHTLNLC